MLGASCGGRVYPCTSWRRVRAGAGACYATIVLLWRELENVGVEQKRQRLCMALRILNVVFKSFSIVSALELGKVGFFNTDLMLPHYPGFMMSSARVVDDFLEKTDLRVVILYVCTGA